MPARVCPLIAVMRISNEPSVRFHCIPQAEALPSAFVVTISRREPFENVPLGPSSGNRKLIDAFSIGLPVSSVTWTLTPRVARPPRG